MFKNISYQKNIILKSLYFFCNMKKIFHCYMKNIIKIIFFMLLKIIYILLNDSINNIKSIILVYNYKS